MSDDPLSAAREFRGAVGRRIPMGDPAGSSSDTPAARLATRLSFLVPGFAIAAWAPLVPFAKVRLGVDDGVLGLLLLCLGIGSVIAMAATGPLIARHGARRLIVAGGLGLPALLPALAVASNATALGAALLLFGAALGSIEVAMNVHAIEVERAAARPLMSGFHALFSVGGFVGSVAMTALLALGLGAVPAALLCALPMLGAVLLARPRLLAGRPAEGGPVFALPRGVVLLLAGLAAATFLVEGAMLDWSALLLSGKELLPRDRAGLGYAVFAVAMTAGRFSGDRLTARAGDRATLVGGGALAVVGFALLLLAPDAALALAGFALIGLGASNVVPVFFRRAGTQGAMPAGLAVAAITTAGYAGVLVGPALVGFAAQAIGLPAAFWILAGLMALVPLTARAVVAGR